ncbi:DivIVA domain-containing protein [Plantactinospora solaniradicis]|uniref:Cell wall synthesis protein Wag31 n=1 Tax=Plantactinospora solaniradicis TaxID=1723736 RepID=A0ABW1KA39_9ACTN
MRQLLRRILTRSRKARRWYAVVGGYRSASYRPIRPWQVRGRQFTVTWRGLDPDEVAAFLDRVGDDLGGVYAELARSREETARIKDALRRWQSSQASMREMARR